MKNLFSKITSLVVVVCFVFSSLNISFASAQEFSLPIPGTMIHLSPDFELAHLRGMVIHKDDPFRLDFFVNKGEKPLGSIEKRKEYQNLIKYFLAALATPDDDQWVNLSPYEKNRIIAPDFAKTTMGRDLLAEDYMLKQLTASLVYPEGQIGKKFWSLVYAKAQAEFGTTNIPVNTFNKVWILPDKAVLYQDLKTNSVYIIDSKLKVMLEEDYLSLAKHTGITQVPASQNSQVNKLGSQIVRQIVLPELEKEVNTAKNFAPLRQIYSAMILATWYKKELKKSLLAKIYVDQAKVKGIDQNPLNNQLIYKRYIKAFKTGVYNYIREEFDPITQQTIPRKYFSGGFLNDVSKAMVVLNDPAQLSVPQVLQFTNEAVADLIDRVGAYLGPIRDNQGTNLTVTVSPLRKFGMLLSKSALVGLAIIAAGCDSKTATPQEHTLAVNALDFIRLQTQLHQDEFKGISVPDNLDQAVDDGLDDIESRWIKSNDGHILTPEMLYLSKLLPVGIDQSQHPYRDLVTAVAKEEDNLHQKMEDGTITSDERNRLDGISKEAIHEVQLAMRGTSDLSTNPNYTKDKPFMFMVPYLTISPHKTDCEGFSATTLYAGKKMRIVGLYMMDVLKDAKGQTFPGPDGYGHRADAFKIVRETGPMKIRRLKNQLMAQMFHS